MSLNPERSHSHRGVVIAAAVLVLLPTVVLVLRSVPVSGANSGHDASFAIHMQRLYAQELISHHQFPVRWLRDGNDGFGSPAFYFYPQLGFLLSTAWQILFGLNPDRALVVTMALARAVAFAGAYIWIRLRVPDRRLAALGAALFLLSPHIATSLTFQRFFFAESVALMWLPLVLLAVDAPWRPGVRILVGAALFALLALTHIPQAVLVGLLAIGYAAACHGRRRAAEVIGAGALGALIAAIGLVPAVLLRDWINAAGWKEWYVTPTYNALFSPRILDLLRKFPAYVTLGVLHANWLLLAAAAAALVWVRGVQRLDRMERGLVLVLVLVLLAMTWPAEPLWDTIPVLSDLQFPWRYMASASLLAAAAAATAGWARPGLIGPLGAVVVLLAAGQTIAPLADYILSERWWIGERYRLPQFASSSAERMTEAEQSNWKDPPEYVPRGAYIAGWQTLDREKWQSAHAVLAAPVVRAGDAQVEMTTRPDAAPGSLLQLDADVRSLEGAVVRLPQLAWPALKLKGLGVLEPDPETGLSLLRLPPGRTQTQLVLTTTRPEEFGMVLSGVGCAIWLAGLAWTVGDAARRWSARPA